MPIIKQYVNLPTGVTNINGPTREMKLQPNTIPNVSAGDRVEWWVEPVGGNNVDEQYLSLAARAHMQHAETVIAPSSFFENNLILPHVGGDQYVVKASKKNDRPNFVASDTFETWRKLYYTVHYMGNASLNFFNALEGDFKAAFLPGFLELENVAKIATLTVQARVNASLDRSGGGLSFPFMDGSANAVMDLAPDGAGTLSSKPYHVALLVVPNILKTNPVPNNASFTNPVGTTNYNHLLYTEVGNPRAFITQGDIRWTGHPWTNVQANFAVTTNTSRNSVITWDFSTVAGLTTHLATPGNTYDLRWTVVKESPVMGYSIFNFCIVRTLDGMTDVLQTFTHEVGHGIGQAVNWEDRWNAAGASIAPEANPKWYDDVYGGRGPHCSTNATLRPAVGLTSGQEYRYGGAGHLCTMYHAGESHVEPKGKFCAAHCEPRIKRRNLDTASLNAKFWNYFG